MVVRARGFNVNVPANGTLITSKPILPYNAKRVLWMATNVNTTAGQFVEIVGGATTLTDHRTGVRVDVGQTITVEDQGGFANPAAAAVYGLVDAGAFSVNMHVTEWVDE